MQELDMTSHTTPKQQDVSKKNADFWDELCGTQLAKQLGITDNSQASLKRFDDWYFDFYPYLNVHIPFNDMRGKDVLEVGLGYGTVSERIAAAGANYSGLDIAASPVAMANHRISGLGRPGGAVQGSILTAPFADGSFDYVVAIGCLHHTGDLKRAIAETYRILRPGGKLIFMVYYAYSWRRWRQLTRDTFSYVAQELAGHRGVVGQGDERQRAAYDVNGAGDGAPHTDWISKRSLKTYCSRFRTYQATIENIDTTRWASRERLLATGAPRVLGLDLYATAMK
jgi:SAM-dependent methyltransferase